MKDYSVFSKLALVICLCLIILAVANGFTGFINPKLSASGTVICVVVLCIAIFAVTVLEKEKKKHG